jgi:4-hydroxy-4-methyl-2-oxoglutarate aldolase
MPEWPPSVRVDIDRPSAADVKAAEYSTATLHEAAGKVGALPAAIKPVSPSMRVSGAVVTVSCPPGDNLRIHHAIYVAQPGDVLVVDVGGGHEYGYWGEIMTVAARARGLAGIVIDGCVRDGDRLAEIGFPVFARGLCIRGTAKDPTKGSVNHPIRLADVDISPGDLVVGDCDGVVIIPRARIGEVTAASHQRESAEAGIIEQLRNGARTIDLYGFAPSHPSHS